TLQARAGAFNFFQAVALCEEYLHNRGENDPLAGGRLRFFSDPSLRFPASDISRITAEGNSVKMVLAFMGLTGASSPLPVYFTEYIVKYPEHAGALEDFLAIFNHRFYVFFYRAWKKYRFLQALGAIHGSPVTTALMRLAGLTQRESKTSGEQALLLTYAGMLASKSRSAEGLKTLIADFFGGIPCAVREFTGRWAPNPNPCCIGAGAQLGVNTVVGTMIWDVAGKISVCLGPLPRQQFEQFLPGTEKIGKVRELVTAFLIDPLAFDIEVTLASMDLVPVILGNADARLGETSSLGNSDESGNGHTIVINCN
ncbi:MAG: type VI secretion system baseplate subunit TssG, partial [Chitinivibrionales bacterium]|nr:type VI secretion system baseplate subunit TssG [Chitinivibrionales bacterium]